MEATSARKQPWKEPGLESALRRAKLDAGAAARERTNDPEAKSGIEHLRFHDLRGTAATNFIRAGLDLNDAATILGVEEGQGGGDRRPLRNRPGDRSGHGRTAAPKHTDNESCKPRCKPRLRRGLGRGKKFNEMNGWGTRTRT